MSIPLRGTDVVLRATAVLFCLGGVETDFGAVGDGDDLTGPSGQNEYDNIDTGTCGLKRSWKIASAAVLLCSQSFLNLANLDHHQRNFKMLSPGKPAPSNHQTSS